MPQRYQVLITGASGMLGVDLCQELTHDYDVYGLDLVQRPESSVQRFAKCDITDKEGVREAILKIRPDVVIHAAAWTDVDGCELDGKKAYRINGGGTENVALVCKNTDAILIYISTDFVFDGKKKMPYKETDEPKPVNIYGDSKLKGERAIKKILKRYFIIRTSWLYGKHGKNFVDAILEMAKRDNILKVVNDQIGSPTYTKDLAKAIHALIDKIAEDKGSGGIGQVIYHVTNSGRVSWYEYAKEILRTVGFKTTVAPITEKELGRPAKRPAMSVLNNSKFIEFTGYRMRGWKAALSEYLKNQLITGEPC